MATQSLAIKYRPKTWDDVTEQKEIRLILQQQLADDEVKHGYLFCGPAGCGKTTAARIFANDINKGQGQPIELDAASNNSVDDIRRLIDQAQMIPLDCEYKVFILDEVHSLSNNAWQAFLKTLEEPPAKAIFIMCTTDPQKIPATILSRAQRYNFQKISMDGIVDRLFYILENEGKGRDIHWEKDAVEYIAKLAEGGMRDAITLLDKCLSFSSLLSLQNVVDALNVVDYTIMMKLTDLVTSDKEADVITVIEDLYNSGKDLKQFIKSYVQFLLDCKKYFIGCDWKYISMPKIDTYVKWLEDNKEPYYRGRITDLLTELIYFSSDIKYSSTVKYDVEACLLRFMNNDRTE